MFFSSAVRSAAGAADYFAKDNYYTQGENAEASRWGGRGAAALGLDGVVDRDTFEALLNSTLPDGTQVNTHENRRAGLDLVFSMPKSASILAYVGKDERILEANRAAVKSAMAWVEKNAAEVRSYERDTKNGEGVRTGNLVYGMFEHDTSRALDPQAHIHVVVAAISQTSQGTWKALWNEEIFQNNSTIGSIYHAKLRAELEKLGYETKLTGKHGQFEIDGVPKKTIDELSQRRQEILDKAEQLGITTPQGQDQVVRRTRDAKVVVEDHDALRKGWTERALSTGYDASQTVEAAKSRRIDPERPLSRPALKVFAESVQGTLSQYLRPNDPLATNGIARIGLTPTQLRTEMAVASAIRILGENEAAFAKTEIAKRALDLNFKNVTIEGVEARIAVLTQRGHLVEGKSTRLDGVVQKVTTPEHIRLERQILQLMEFGRGQGQVVLPADEAKDKLANVDRAALVKPLDLTTEQMSAAVGALSSPDRVFVIQGVGGAGKTVMVDTMARAIEPLGYEILGLAVAATAAKKLHDDAKIKTDTVEAFVLRYMPAARQGQGPRFEKAKAELANKLVYVDEFSMVGSKHASDLLTIQQAFDIPKLIPLGDRDQILAVNHGNPNASMQAAKVDMAVLTTSMRQKTPEMQEIVKAARNRDIAGAFNELGDRLTQAGPNFLEVAAEKWLALSAEMRAKTDIYTSGRQARATINELVQEGLRKEGTLKGEPVLISGLQAVNLSREEMRFPHVYEPGMTLEVMRNGTIGNLAKGQYQVVSSDKNGRVYVRGPKGTVSFAPGKIPPNLSNDALRLMERRDMKVFEGDTLRLGMRDKEKDIFKSEKAEVLAANGDKITLKLEDGRVLDVQPNDPLMKHASLNYALNMHQAQGATKEYAIGAMNANERNLSNARLFYVMVSRVEYNMEIVTNNTKGLQMSLERNMGDKGIALQITGELNMPQPKQPSVGVRFQMHPNMISNADLRANPAEHRDPQPPMPEKSKERSL